jgi:uncharacterized repeat protein (TIGR01451 family)
VISRLVILFVLLAASHSASGFVITRTSSPIFYLDTSITPTLQGMYVSYQINNNSGSSYPDIWVRIDSFTGGVISPAPGEDSLMHLGALAPGQTKAAFFYLQASAATAVAQTHTVRIYPSRAAAGELANASFAMTAEETIQANANKVVTVVTGPTPPQLGGIVTMTVSGDAGTIGASRILSFSPAAYLNWRPDAYEMISSSITLSGGNTGTYNDQLLIITANSSATTYSAVYQFRAVNTTTTPTTVSPISYISSGAQIKHTTTGTYGSIPPIDPTQNLLTIGKQASVSELFGPTTITYTLFATNSGTVDVILEDFADTLPTSPAMPGYVSGSSRFNGAAIADPIISGSTLTWIGVFALPPGATRSLTFQASFANVSGSYTNRAVGHVGVTQIDTTLNTADNLPALAIVTVRGLSVSGFVYLDANRNSQKEASETGTGLSLFAKLVSATAPGGPALQSVVVTNTTGAYTFPNVIPGTYNIVIDNNNTLSDVVPNLPAGWIGTEQPTQIRQNVLVISADVTDRNFGLINGRTVSGRTFNDNGAGGGTANDGLLNGTEAGRAGNQFRLTDIAGTTVYDTVNSDGSGNFQLFIPATIVSGTQLRVVEFNPSGFLSTGGRAGNTGGTYDRTTDAVTFTFGATNYQGLLFGNVADNSLLNDSQQTGLPGSFVLHSHRYLANSAGQLTFTLTQISTPNIPGWNPVIYLDANCNGQIEATEQPLSTPLAVTSGQQICILIKDAIPINAPFNAQHQMTLSAQFQYTGASPSLARTNSRTALTLVGNPTTAGLTLLKAVDKSTALPGETITYTLNYANNSSEALANLVIFDATPAFTTFLSANAAALPGNLTAVSISPPAVGSSGFIRWTFTGTLAPGKGGVVTFSVVVSQ